jgi:hypothetical protein
MVRMEGGKNNAFATLQTKTYQATGVAFVVIQFTTWILEKLIGGKVGAVNACFDSFFMLPAVESIMQGYMSCTPQSMT